MVSQVIVIYCPIIILEFKMPFDFFESKRQILESGTPERLYGVWNELCNMADKRQMPSDYVDELYLIVQQRFNELNLQLFPVNGI
jgi:hypothetical protein